MFVIFNVYIVIFGAISGQSIMQFYNGYHEVPWIAFCVNFNVSQLGAKNDDSNIKEGTDFPLAVEKRFKNNSNIYE